MKTHSSTTIRMIATEANVSAGTVSRALRGSKRVAENTRQQINEIADQLNYRPNRLMRAVRSQRTQAVGVILPEEMIYWGPVFSGINEELMRNDHMPLVVSFGVNTPSRFGLTLLDLIHRLIDWRVDGVIFVPGVLDDQAIKALAQVVTHNKPLISVDQSSDQLPSDFVGQDDVAGAGEVARYLLSLGHRRLGHLAGPAVTSTAHDRRIGFERVVNSRPDASCVTIVRQGTYEEADREAEVLLTTEPRPTAIFAANDFFARSAYRVARALGLRVPQDVSVVGYSDLEFSSWLEPALTTVDHRPRRIGQLAAKLALSRVAGGLRDKRPRQWRITPRLIRRQSVCPP